MNFFKPILPETSNSTTPDTIGSIIVSKLLTGSLIISENIIVVLVPVRILGSKKYSDFHSQASQLGQSRLSVSFFTRPVNLKPHSRHTNTLLFHSLAR